MPRIDKNVERWVFLHNPGESLLPFLKVDLKKYIRSFFKNQIYLPYDPSIPLPGVHPRKIKVFVHTNICTQMFMAALFITAKN